MPTGCVDQGAESDIQSVRAVVDWMNGRASAVDADGNAVRADWTNGKVGMIGKSYDGTLANGVAATGVRGLETIVPISAISSWYDYDRYQGLPFSYDYPSWLSGLVAGNRSEPVDCTAVNQRMAAEDGDETGAYTQFWSRRDYRKGPTSLPSRLRYGRTSSCSRASGRSATATPPFSDTTDMYLARLQSRPSRPVGRDCRDPVGRAVPRQSSLSRPRRSPAVSLVVKERSNARSFDAGCVSPATAASTAVELVETP